MESLHDKFRFVVAMFREVNLSAVLNVETEDFAMFLYNISLHYDSRTNPFHNFNHGITGKHVAVAKEVSERVMAAAVKGRRVRKIK